jgi:hypothetical protein
MKSILLILFATFFASTTYGQSGNSDHCEVVAVDVIGRNAENIDKGKEIPLGSFDTIIGEEVATTKAYRLPKTRLFVIANVWYTDESMASEKGADSISLELTVSAKRKRDVLASAIYADAEFPLNGFDVGRVTTKVKAGQSTFLLVMECRKKVRLNSGADTSNKRLKRTRLSVS